MLYQKQKVPYYRILKIVQRLYNLEDISSKVIAQEFTVSVRTIHRDMLKINEVIPLVNNLGVWNLDTEKMSKNIDLLPYSLLASFAQNIDIDIDCLNLTDVIQESVSFATEYKDFPKYLGEKIMQCINDNNRCQFTYRKENGFSNRIGDPIKFYTENGRWYLVLRDYKDNKVKTFLLNKINDFKQIKDEYRSLTSNMIKEASTFQSVWFSGVNKPIKVKLYLKPEMSHYRDIKLHKSEVIYDEHHDGGRETHYIITHQLQILPAIKSWLPNVYILEPKWLHDMLMEELQEYQDSDKKIDFLTYKCP